MPNKPTFLSKKIKVLVTPTNLPSVPMPNLGNPAAFINLDGVNMKDLTNELNRKLKNPQGNSGWLGSFFQEKRIRADEQMLSHISSYISQLRGINNSLTQYKVEVFISQQVLTYMLQKKYELAQREIDVQIKRYENELDRLKYEAELRRLTLAKVQLEIDILRLEFRRREITVNFIDKIFQSIDETKLPESIKSLYAQWAMNPNVDKITPLEFLDQLEKLVLKEKEMDIEFKRANVRKENADATTAEHAAKKTIEREE